MTEQEAHRQANFACVIGFLTGGVIVGMFTLGFTYETVERHYKRECISRGVAEYDAKTAQFKWLVEPKGE